MREYFFVSDNDFMAILTYGLLISALIGAAVTCVCMGISKLFKSAESKHTILLLGQLSLIPILLISLWMSPDFQKRRSLKKPKPVAEQFIEKVKQISVGQQDVETLLNFRESVDEELPQVAESPYLQFDGGQEARGVSFKPLLAKIQYHAPVVISFWGLGVLILVIRWLFGASRLAKYRRTSLPVAEDVVCIFERASKKLNVYKAELKESAGIVSPMVIGALKPMILVPIGFGSNLTTEQVEAIFLHELAHIKRYDYLWNTLQRVVEILFFFNPFVWWIGRMCRQVREEACDQQVVSFTGNPREYARALLSLAEDRFGNAVVAAKGGSLQHRFEALFGKKVKRLTFGEMLLLMALSALSLTPIFAEGDTKEEGSIPKEIVWDSPSGEVLGPDGMALEGANVILYYQPYDWWAYNRKNPERRIVEEVKTDAKGAFSFTEKLRYENRIDHRWRDRYIIIAQHELYSVMWELVPSPNLYALESEHRKFSLKMKKGKSKIVRVVSKEDGKPISGVSLQYGYLYPDKYENPLYRPILDLHNIIDRIPGVTDEKGELTIRNMLPYKTRLLVEDSRLEQKYVTIKNYDDSVSTVECTKGVSVKGRVCDANGRPLSKRLVYASPEKWNQRYVAFTDEDGNYEISGLRLNRKYNLRVVSKNHSFERESFTSSEENQQIDFKSTPLHEVIIKVVDFDSQNPVKNAYVDSRLGSPSVKLLTNSKGVVKLALPEGEVYISVSPPKGYYFERDEFHRTNAGRRLKILKGRNTYTLFCKPKKAGDIYGDLSMPAGVDSVAPSIEFVFKDIDRRIVRSLGGISSFNAELLNVGEGKQRFILRDMPLDCAYEIAVTTKSADFISGGAIEDGYDKVNLKLSKSLEQKIRIFDESGELMRKKEIHYGVNSKGRQHTHFKRWTDAQGLVTLRGIAPNVLYFVHKGGDDDFEATFQMGATQGEVIDVRLEKGVLLQFVGEAGEEVVPEKWIELRGDVLDEDGNQESWRLYSRFENDHLYIDFLGKWRFSKSMIGSFIHRKAENLEVYTLEGDGSTSIWEGELNHEKIILTLKNSRESMKQKIANIEGVRILKAHEKLPPKIWEGRVVDEKGTPIAGVRYGFRRPDLFKYINLKDKAEDEKKFNEKQKEAWKKHRESMDGRAITNSKGEFKIELVYWQSHILFEVEGYALRWVPNFVMNQGAAEITLFNSCVLTGMISDETGKRRSFERFRIVHDMEVESDSELEKIGPFADEIETDENGMYRVLLSPGNYIVRDRFSDEFILNTEFKIKRGEQKKINPKPERAAEWRVEVKDAVTGEPVVGEGFSLYVNTGEYRIEPFNPSEPITLTNDEGMLIFKGLYPEGYTISKLSDSEQSFSRYTGSKYAKAEYANLPKEEKWKEDNPIKSINLEIGLNGREDTILLSKGVQIKGKVHCDEAVDFRRISVCVKSRNYNLDFSNFTIRLDEQGGFDTFIPISETPIALCAYEGGNGEDRKYASAFSKEFQTKPGEVYHFDLDLKRGVIVKGRFVDTDGNPIEGLSINLVDSYRNDPGMGTQTAKDGTFVLGGLSSKETEIIINDYAKGLNQKITLHLEKIQKVLDVKDVVFTPK